ncbi:MAG: hypothetical protein QOG61_2552 [Candidatus Binataceae bacterium]|nr:hypothetical protein [Candidatus Binataceae bacterium]
MPTHPAKVRPSIVPAMRYRDARAAIEWLCKAFGFEQRLVVPGATDSVIVHAQIVFDNGMIMLASMSGKEPGHSEFDRLMKHPDEIGGCETQSAYIIVPDADTHYAHAKAAGAQILLDIKDQDYGGRGYTCRDLEGHIWSFGTYDPWEERNA